MVVYTYQSQAVLNILRRGEVYRAKPSIAFQREYEALIDLLELKCKCPIFGVLKGRRKNTGGKVSDAVRIKLDIPEKYIFLTEYAVWADFIYAMKFTKKHNYRELEADCQEISGKEYRAILDNLANQRKPSSYKTPQVVLEKIKPAWMVDYRMQGHRFRLFSRR